MATSFGMRLRRLREAKKLTLQQVADAVGCTRGYIWELEMRDGEQRPSAERVYLLAKTLGVTVEDLMEDAPREVPEAKPEDIQFFREYAGMSDVDKETYRDALKMMFRIRDQGDEKHVKGPS